MIHATTADGVARGHVQVAPAQARAAELVHFASDAVLSLDEDHEDY
eukprot:SAG31_NODE_17309_length_676_cov_0.533795_1_plen_45_part_10